MKRLWCRRCRHYFKIPKRPRWLSKVDYDSECSLLHHFVSEHYCCKTKDPEQEVKMDKRKRYWWYEIYYKDKNGWWMVGGRNTKGDAVRLAKLLMKQNNLPKSKTRIERCWREVEVVEWN